MLVSVSSTHNINGGGSVGKGSKLYSLSSRQRADTTGFNTLTPLAIALKLFWHLTNITMSLKYSCFYNFQTRVEHKSWSKIDKTLNVEEGDTFYSLQCCVKGPIVQGRGDGADWMTVSLKWGKGWPEKIRKGPNVIFFFFLYFTTGGHTSAATRHIGRFLRIFF